ncbi:MAG: hypothetical protein NTV44_01050, partial [Firmicutes bacterium]|nr:hypothetical protein [Bacillota bacterium]
MKKVRNIFTLLYLILYVIFLFLIYNIGGLGETLKPYRLPFLVIFILVFLTMAALIILENAKDKKAEKLNPLLLPPAGSPQAKAAKTLKQCGFILGITILLGFLSISLLIGTNLGGVPPTRQAAVFRAVLRIITGVSWVALLIALVISMVFIAKFNKTGMNREPQVASQSAASQPEQPVVPSNIYVAPVSHISAPSTSSAAPVLQGMPMFVAPPSVPEPKPMETKPKVELPELPMPPLFKPLPDRRVVWFMDGLLTFYFDYTSKDPEDISLCARYKPIKVRYEQIECFRVEPSAVPNEEASVCFYYKDAGNLMKLEFSLGAEVTLNQIIPEKEYAAVQAQKAQAAAAPTPVVPITTITRSQPVAQPVIQPAIQPIIQP